MDISVLDSTLIVPDTGAHAPSLVSQAITRSSIFRFLLAGVAKPGDRVIDLAAGPCLFAKIARDEGCIVTAVDARVERKPSDEELGTIRFIQSDIRNFDLQGFDIILCLGMLYHFDVDDQLRFLERCARSGVPIILETQIHVDALVPADETLDWARKVVRREHYDGIVFPEQDNPMASVGNPESFWATEASLLRMMEDAGFTSVARIDPLYRSKYGARRYFLLNCRRFVANPDVLAKIVLVNHQAKIVDLVNRERFDEAREAVGRTVPADGDFDDPAYAMAVARMRIHFGEPDKAISAIKHVRDHVLGFGERMVPILLRCADFFVTAGDARQAELTRAAAFERIANPSFIKALIEKSVASGALYTSELLTQVEARFAGNVELLDLAASTYYATKDFEAAERTCRAALALEPENAKLLARLGDLLLRRGDRLAAQDIFARARLFDPENPTTLERLAAVCLELKDKEGAEHFARELISRAPRNPKAHMYLARALRGRHRKAEAIAHAKRAVELDPKNTRYSDYVALLSSPAKAPTAEPDN